MARKKQTKTPRGNAAKNKSSTAGKRAEHGATAARSAPSNAPAKGAGHSEEASKATKSGLFKFRRYKKVEGGKKKKAKHPKLIVEQKQTTVGFMGLTESPKRGHHNNIELDVNPEKGNSDKAFIRKEIRYVDLGEFGEILKNYNLSEKDKKKVVDYLNKLKNKK